MTDGSLSEKIFEVNVNMSNNSIPKIKVVKVIHKDLVREFIKKLKKKMKEMDWFISVEERADCIQEIDELAGEELSNV